MTTASDICTNALMHIGAIAIEDTPSSAEASNTLNSLNAMIDTWNTESTMIYNIEKLVFPFVANKLSYTLGSGGDWNTARPVEIVDFFVRDSAGNDLPCEEVTEQEYSAIITKTTTSALPFAVYDDGNFPLKNLYWWPVASDASFSAVLWAWQPLTGSLTLTTAISLPPGYQDALEYNLAIRLGPRYGRAISADLRSLAVLTKSAIERQNLIVRELSMDSSIPRSRRGSSLFAYYTGQ